MIALLDRRLSSSALLAAIEGTDADLLARLPASRKRPILQHPGDGSFLRSCAGLAQ